MSHKDQQEDGDRVVLLTPRKTRRARPTSSHQLDVSQRRESSDRDNSIWPSPPRPHLQRSPHSSPVLFSTTTRQKDKYQDRAAYASQPRAPAGEEVSTQEYRLPPLSFEKNSRSEHRSFDHVFSEDHLSDRPRLRRVAKMKTTQNLRTESTQASPRQPPQRRALAVINNTSSRQPTLSSPTPNTIAGSSAVGRIKRYSLDDQSYFVHFVDYSIGDVLSSKLPVNEPISPTSELYLNGIMYIYDVTKTDILLYLPGLLDVLKQVKLPVALVPVGATTFEHETKLLSEAIDRQCDLVEDDLEVFRAPATLNAVEDCVSLLLARIEARSDSKINHDLWHIRPVTRRWCTNSTTTNSDPFTSTEGGDGQLDRYRSRNDSKFSNLSNQSTPDINRAQPPPLTQPLRTSVTPEKSTPDRKGKVLYDLDTIKASVQSNRRVYTLEELVRRLLETPTSSNDQKFTNTLLTVYKLFATPLELLTTMLVCSGANLSENDVGVGSGLQARLVAIIHFWIVSFPGDFASKPVADCLRTYLFAFSLNDSFKARRQQIRQALDTVVANDDTRWAYCDKLEDSNGGISNLGKIVTQERRRSTYRLTPISPATSQISNSSGGRHNDRNGHIDAIGSPTTEDKRFKASKVNSRTRMSLSGFQRPNLSPSSSSTLTTNVLGRVHWRMFMDVPTEVLAQTIATTNRHLFSAAKPRDFIRQITLTSTKRAKFSSLASIAELTAQFNHLAHWTATLVLVREKAKERAQTLEKLMKIGRRVRELNDYNGVGAIVAGVHNTAIHRLAATRELLDKDVAKDFARLEILMGTARGHAAYKLAWENTSFKGRVPYMPVLLSDLVVADACGPIFSDQSNIDTPVSPTTPVSASATDRTTRPINWHKFALIGETLHQLEMAQAAMPAHVPVESAEREDARTLLLDTIVMEDDDELYARSCLLEPTISNHTVEDSSTKRRFMDKLMTLGSAEAGIHA